MHIRNHLVRKSVSNSRVSAICLDLGFSCCCHCRRRAESREDQSDNEEEESEEEDDDEDPANSRDAPDPRDCTIS